MFFLQSPLPDLAAWMHHFHQADIPVQAETAQGLEVMRAAQDKADAHRLAELIATDPLMSVKLMSHAARYRSPRVVTDPDTVTAVLVMMGVDPFFRDFGRQAVMEDVLKAHPCALAELQGVVRRVFRAASWALTMALESANPMAPVIYFATLLHDFVPMLLWCHAPELALQVQAAQRADPSANPALIQQQVLNVELAELQKALMQLWRLPTLLLQWTDEAHAQQTNVRTMVLAIRLAQHTAQGWDHPALLQDIADIARLLKMSPDNTLELLKKFEQH